IGGITMLVSNRVANILLVLILAVGIGIVAMLASGARGGPLDPPGPPSATGTLPQVEPRMPIPPVGWNGTFPIAITQPGSYFLTRNLTDSTPSTDGIDITDNVTLDLNGFTVAGTPSTFDGISGGTYATVRNGSLSGWGAGDLSMGPHTQIDHVKALNSTGNGIWVGYDSAVTNCEAFGNAVGIVISSSGRVSDCTVSSNQTGILLRESDASAEDNIVTANTGAGIQAGSNFGAPRVVITRNHAVDNNPDIALISSASNAIVTENDVGSCTSIVDGGSGDYVPFAKVTGAGSTAVGLEHTNIAHAPNGAGLC
ncbi:MAG: right-handed parallel beta-helix repeat-containing protein, partial [Vicinamibacterales bacterium]